MQEFIDFMLKTMTELGAVGLAAPQLGVSKQIFVLNDGTVCINPVVVGHSGKITSHAEGCLSVNGQRYDVKRTREVIIKYFDRGGKLQTLKPRSKLSNVAVQHEMDHLNGKLICDRGRPRR
jgi:peptide deformylase